MNFSQAKQIPIVEYLARRGVHAVSIQGSKHWYFSPLRGEKTPSFKVDTERNIWYDHGGGQGGTIIELVQTIDNLTPIDALQQLAKNENSYESFSFHQQQSSSASELEDRVKIKSVKLLSNAALVKYLESRAIPFHLGRKYLSECYYSVGEKSFFALGFQNDKGGYELRNSLWKGASSPKSITTQILPNRSTVAVFEGFFDMLSALVYFNREEPLHSILVLNSVSLLDTALPILANYEQVNLFLDNDTAGKKANEIIRAACPSAIDYAIKYYPNHKDFNDLLISKDYEQLS